MKDARVYGILDLGYVTVEEAVGKTSALLAGGVDLVQLRAKGIDAFGAQLHKINPTGEKCRGLAHCLFHGHVAEIQNAVHAGVLHQSLSAARSSR